MQRMSAEPTSRQQRPGQNNAPLRLPVGLQGLVRTTRRGGLGPASSAASQSRSGWPLHTAGTADGRHQRPLNECHVLLTAWAAERQPHTCTPAVLAWPEGHVVSASAHLNRHEVVEVVRPARTAHSRQSCAHAGNMVQLLARPAPSQTLALTCTAQLGRWGPVGPAPRWRRLGWPRWSPSHRTARCGEGQLGCCWC